MSAIGELFISLSDKQRTMITNQILNASYIFDGGGDFRGELKRCASRSAGNIKKIYIELYELSNSDFNKLITEMVK